MKNLKQYLYDGDINEVINNYYSTFYINNNFDETYEEYCYNHQISPSYINEQQFYDLKFNDNYVNTPQYWVWQELLYENLNSIKTTSSMFYNLFKVVENIENVDIVNDYVVTLQVNDKFSINQKDFKQLLNFGNYFIQTQNDSKITIEARKPEEIKNYDFDYLYHVTTKYAYEKIKKYGLLPKDKTTLVNHCNRIYFYTHYDKISMLQFGRLQVRLYKMLVIGDNNKHNLFDINNTDITILKIDLKQFNKDHNGNLKLFGDNANLDKFTVFTQEPIPTKYITAI